MIMSGLRAGSVCLENRRSSCVLIFFSRTYVEVGNVPKNVPETTAVNPDDDDDEMEQEEMFVKPHESFEFRTMEWGGPRRGGRLPEPTRYGDWERKGRCTDF